jgi:hypothetical protein
MTSVSTQIILGFDPAGNDVALDVEELLATRLLVQGNSGSGKSHLLRRLLEESAGMVQQVVIDPEGDFVSLAEAFGHVIIDGAAYQDVEIARLAARIREHRASVILALDGLEVENQMRCAAVFLSGLFDAPAEHWYPALVIVDEAQVFAPAVAGDVSDEARRSSLGAMTNLMCRGRKRGLAGVIATQRLAKLAKNVAAEASNLLMGRTFLDIDMVRAADLLGMERRQAEQIRDLERGHFLGLGPAVSRRPVAVKVGGVRTSAKSTASGMIPPPPPESVDMETLLMTSDDSSAVSETYRPPAFPVIKAAELQDQIANQAQASAPEEADPLEPEEAARLLDALLREMAAEEGCTFQSTSALYQDFTVRCRMHGIKAHGLNVTEFRKRLSALVAGFTDWPVDEDTSRILALAETVPDELQTPFLAIANAAISGRACPNDEELAVLYGTSSVGRARRMLGHLERSGLIVIRTDFGGRRTIAIPQLSMSTIAA